MKSFKFIRSYRFKINTSKSKPKNNKKELNKNFNLSYSSNFQKKLITIYKINPEKITKTLDFIFKENERKEREKMKITNKSKKEEVNKYKLYIYII